MSRLPYELDRRESVQQARIVMHGSGIRHLPIMDGAQLFGVVSIRDVPRGVVDGNTRLSEVCARDVFTVSPTDSVVEAARGMMRRKISSAVVLDAEVVVGMFTSNDAMAALIAAYEQSDGHGVGSSR
jgi:CBS domain-containing protein